MIEKQLIFSLRALRTVAALLVGFAIVACSKPSPEAPSVSVQDKALLSAVLASQPEEVRQRYGDRQPLETLSFLGIKPGMTVVEALPGGGWYSRILLDYLGEQGTLIGADYGIALYANFPWMTKERLEEKQRWVPEWIAKTGAWRKPNSAAVAAFQFGALPAAHHGQADAVLFIRALHNLARFDGGAFLDEALKDAWDSLKPGGTLGIVQHEARPEMPDSWADGSNGYLKRSHVISRAEAAGFTLLDESDINANPKDQPGIEDKVWRLPPSLRVEGDDPVLKAVMEDVGESNRMTLKFRKPG